MPRIDYFGIETEIQEILKADSDLSGVTVEVEDGPETLERCPFVEIRLLRTDAPAEIQRIAAGQQTTFEIQFSVLCWEYSLESIRDARKKRNDLLGKVQVVLMNNRTLNEKVTNLRLEGGEMWRSDGEAGFGSTAEITVICEATASTT